MALYAVGIYSSSHNIHTLEFYIIFWYNLALFRTRWPGEFRVTYIYLYKMQKFVSKFQNTPTAPALVHIWQPSVIFFLNKTTSSDSHLGIFCIGKLSFLIFFFTYYICFSALKFPKTSTSNLRSNRSSYLQVWPRQTNGNTVLPI